MSGINRVGREKIRVERFALDDCWRWRAIQRSGFQDGGRDTNPKTVVPESADYVLRKNAELYKRLAWTDALSRPPCDPGVTPADHRQFGRFFGYL